LQKTNFFNARKDIEAKLNVNEKKAFHNLLRRIKELGVIEMDFERAQDAYRFESMIYPIYIAWKL
jgi:hypothetical protein